MTAVVLAPMAGVTDLPFRTLCSSFGSVSTVTEMVSAACLVDGSPESRRRLRFVPDLAERRVQLFAVAPLTTAQATRIVVEELGATHVDLNMGCPARKVLRAGGGAALPTDAARMREVVAAAVSTAGDAVVSVKLRLGLAEVDRTFVASALAAQGEGARVVTLHARSAEMLYAGSADWSAIRTLKDSVDVQVFGNGDVWRPEDAVRMIEETGCDGVVVGRGLLGRPWLGREVQAALEGRDPQAMTWRDVSDVMRAHLELLVEDTGDEVKSLRQLRRHIPGYLLGCPWSVLQALMTSPSAAAFVRELEVFDDTPLDPVAAWAPRGPQQGPQVIPPRQSGPLDERALGETSGG